MTESGSDAAKRMIKAAKAGDAGTVRSMLDEDPGLTDARDTDHSTPLHCAAWKGHVEVARVLLEHGADVHARNKNDHWGDTPLHAAAHGNQAGVAILLIEAGADLHAENTGGRTPLEETEFHRANAVAKLLVQHGASP